VNGERGKTHIHPLSPGHISLVNYCESHMDTLILDAARNVFGADKQLSGIRERAAAHVKKVTQLASLTRCKWPPLRI
jgi:hypothetical protein